MSAFGKAFAAARNAGEPTFEWPKGSGKMFSTRLKGEAKNKKPAPKSAAKPPSKQGRMAGVTSDDVAKALRKEIVAKPTQKQVRGGEAISSRRTTGKTMAGSGYTPGDMKRPENAKSNPTAPKASRQTTGKNMAAADYKPGNMTRPDRNIAMPGYKSGDMKSPTRVNGTAVKKIATPTPAPRMTAKQREEYLKRAREIAAMRRR